MGTRGPKSTAELSVVSADTIASTARLRMPGGLSDVQTRIWLATVNSKPAEWFGQEHMPILMAYVASVETVGVLTDQIQGFDAAWLADDDGLKRYEKLTAMRARESSLVNSLARAMRLTHQSIYRADKAANVAKRAPTAKLWHRKSA